MNPEEKIDSVLAAIEGLDTALKVFHCALKEFRSIVSEKTRTKVVVRKSEGFKEQLMKVLEEERWNKTKVANRYGVGRRTIYRWMKEFGIE